MFTGIVQETGRVTFFSRHQKCDNLKVKSPTLAKNTKIGDSISVNGVCLTVARVAADILYFDLLAETIQLTNLGLLSGGDYVNLEESLRADGKLSGHFVTGHIDCRGSIKKIGRTEENHSFEIEIPREFMRFLVPKGSVAVDGVSLTVVDVYHSSFTFYVIPHTLNATIFCARKTGDKVNIECDILAKYHQRGQQENPSAR